MRIRRSWDLGAAGIAVPLLVVLAAPACSDDSSPTYDLSSPQDLGYGVNVDGCNRLKNGPITYITPGPLASSAVEVKVSTANKVSLTLNQAGWVKFAATSAGDWTFFINMSSLAFEVQNDQYSTINPTKSETSVPQCKEVKAKHSVSLSAAGTYEVRLGPNASVGVILDIEPPSSIGPRG